MKYDEMWNGLILLLMWTGGACFYKFGTEHSVSIK